MVKQRNAKSFNTSLTYLFAFVFLLVSGVVGYKILLSGSVLGITSTEQTTHPIPVPPLSWEFNSANKKDTEGWQGRNLPSPLQVYGGSLHVVTGPYKGMGSIEQNTLSQNPLYGNKFFTIRLAVSPGLVKGQPVPVSQGFIRPVVIEGSTSVQSVSVSSSSVSSSDQSSTSVTCKYFGGFLGKWCPKPIPQPTIPCNPAPQPLPCPKGKLCPLTTQNRPDSCPPSGFSYSFPVIYTLGGVATDTFPAEGGLPSNSSRPITTGRTIAIQGVADGQMHEYSIQLPETETITINNLKILFEGVSPNTKVDIDWIRVRLGDVTPTPTKAMLQVTSPNGGENLFVGQSSVPLTWNFTRASNTNFSYPLKTSIYVITYTQGVRNFVYTIADQYANTYPGKNTYTWSIPRIQPGKYRIYISIYNPESNIGILAEDESDLEFNLLDEIITPTPTPSPCFNAQPQLDIVPQVQNGKLSQLLTYVVNITNLDVKSCGATRFSLSADVPSDWTAKFAYPYIDLYPGQKISLALYITSSSREFFGEQPITVRVFSTKQGQASQETIIYNVIP